MYKQPCDKLYHVFTEDFDEWTSDEREARQLAYTLIRQQGRKYANVRIYIETNWDNEEGLFTDEDCYFAIGNFPN